MILLNLSSFFIINRFTANFEGRTEQIPFRADSGAKKPAPGSFVADIV